LYAYRTNILREIIKLPLSKLETAESLEQLRWIENGYNIIAKITDIETLSIDTPDDLKKVSLFL
jgi:3-deoxy-manno-octulosonate cytidylyltransferase (CMP-KDO synthetase)